MGKIFFALKLCVWIVTPLVQVFGYATERTLEVYAIHSFGKWYTYFLVHGTRVVWLNSCIFSWYELHIVFG